MLDHTCVLILVFLSHLMFESINRLYWIALSINWIRVYQQIPTYTEISWGIGYNVFRKKGLGFSDFLACNISMFLYILSYSGIRSSTYFCTLRFEWQLLELSTRLPFFFLLQRCLFNYIYLYNSESFWLISFELISAW